ncbi:MAG: ArsR family transcriptional regulator [Candidatus Nitrosothermus koennekii]|nr:MAG: ArsR family transcriptional regulator [Candidatus Nitrosothermus koennekii]
MQVLHKLIRYIKLKNESCIIYIGLGVDEYDIFWELAGEMRRNILFKLKEKSMKLSQLAKTLDVSIQEVHRNINRLIDAGLVEKDPDGLLILTTYGEIVLTQIPSFQFLSKNKPYFEEHTLGDLPMKFIQRIGALNNSELINGVVAILARWKDMYRNANEHIMEIMAQVPLDLIEPIVDRLNHGVKFSYIFGENTIVPKGRRELLQKFGWNNFMNKGLVERRMIKRVQVMVIVTDKEAGVLFPNKKGETDMNKMFYSRDPLFHEWCLDFFRYTWYASDIFDETKIKEI